LALGGGLSIIISDFAAATQVTIAQSAITENAVVGGNGGAGGGGLQAGGAGGTAGVLFAGFDASSMGGGLFVKGGNTADTWTLNSDSIASNEAISGNGGAGGAGFFFGGNGGEAFIAFGGGVCDLFTRKLEILNSTIIVNIALRGKGGSGGSGLTPGSPGMGDGSDSGGLFNGLFTACADNTVIAGNSANNDPDVFGNPGTC
jgi:hypothetical protein